MLSRETIRNIVTMQVNLVKERLSAKDIQLQVTDEVLEYIAESGYDPKFGARPLKRVIQSKILTPVASMMIEEGMLQGGTVEVMMKKGELCFDVKKKHKVAKEKKSQKKTAVTA